MPSVRTLLAGLLATALIQLSTASPVPVLVEERAEDCDKPQATPTIPASGNVPDLPTTNLTLAYVAVGRGVQNYTCTAVGAKPSAVGAVATLFDVTALAKANEAAVHAIPPVAVYMTLPTSNFVVGHNTLKPLGHHYFDAAGTPTFDLSSVGKIIYGKKTGDVTAPPTANKGPAGTGAVDWLQLSQKPTYTSVGLQIVYRVVTAGGNAPANCTSTAPISVQYAAEYWYYN